MTLPGNQDETVRWIAELRAEMALDSMRKMYDQAGRTSKKMGEVTKSTGQTEDAMKKGGRAAKEYASSINAARIALGAIVAMVVFRAINFVEESMRKAVETAKEYETSLYRLVNVERILSKAGTEISLAGLKEGIQEIKEVLPIFSEADITQQVSLIGIMTKEWGLTEKQITDTAKAIGVLNIRSGETEDLLTTTNKVLTALVAPSGRGIASLGLNFSEAALKAQALKTGVLQAGQAFSVLTSHDKDMLKLSILLENTGAELSTVKDFLETNTGAMAQMGAEWEDTLRVLGQALTSLEAAAAPFVIGFLNFLQDGINGMKAFIVILQATKDTFYAFVAAFSMFFTNPIGFIKNFDALKEGIAGAFTGGLEDGFKRFFSGQIPQDAPEWFKRIFSNLVEDTDEATGKVEGLGDAVQDLSQVTGFEDLAKDLEKFQDKIDEVNADFELKMTRMFEDFKLDQERLEIDYQRKRADIIRDFNNRIAKQQEDHRTKEENEEAKFQERMRQLREKYLFNLEDALRERDARQVLRLQRQYQMEKQNLINEHALRQHEDDQQQQQELADLAAQRDERLRQLAEEHQIRMQREQEDYEIRRQRAELDHQRDLEDIRRRIDERLMEFARAIGEEFNLNEQGVDALYNLLQAYYGPNGYFDGLYNYSYNSVIERGKAMVQAMNQIIARAQQTAQAVAQALYMGAATANRPDLGIDPYYSSLGGFAKGGLAVATRPTTAVFGESGPELAMFAPLHKSGGGGMASRFGLPGMGGEVSIAVLLSPDLEARIVSSSLEGVSATIESIQRER